MIADILNPAFVFNLDGSTFLTFYALALVGAIFWSIQRKKNFLEKLGPPPGKKPTLRDAPAIAYLAGGPARLTELSLVQLIEKDLVKWKPGGVFQVGKLHADGIAPKDCQGLERSIFEAVALQGQSGLALKELPPVIAKNIKPIEARLAKLGVRPTAKERASIGNQAVLPLVGLIGIGFIKLLVGIAREKPVMFLFAGLLVTFLILLVIKSNVKHLTPAGQALLDRFRSGQEPTPSSGLIGVALVGLAAAPAYAGMSDLNPGLQGELNKLGNSNSSGCGTSGCGGSGGDGGCGGGGCGGCGGCGG